MRLLRDPLRIDFGTIEPKQDVLGLSTEEEEIEFVREYSKGLLEHYPRPSVFKKFAETAQKNRR